MGFLLLQPENLAHQPVRVIFRKAGLFPDVLQYQLGQHRFIDGVDGTRAPSAAGVVAADERAVPSRPAILIGEFFDVVPHFETAVGAVHKSGEDALAAIGRGAFPHLLFSDTGYGIPQFPRNNGLVGPLHPDPLVLRFIDELAGFIGECAAFALYHVPDVDLVADHVFYRLVGPLVVDPAGVALALALVVQHTGRLNPFFIERHRDGVKSHA
ncbi:hypothetical protein IMSAG013_01420 [Clostridiales bacterium]|nr:hypothetical protein IMSAG013_01420 [Clostridiales bacterium]